MPIPQLALNEKVEIGTDILWKLFLELGERIFDGLGLARTHQVLQFGDLQRVLLRGIGGYGFPFLSVLEPPGILGCGAGAQQHQQGSQVHISHPVSQHWAVR